MHMVITQYTVKVMALYVILSVAQEPPTVLLQYTTCTTCFTQGTLQATELTT